MNPPIKDEMIKELTKILTLNKSEINAISKIHTTTLKSLYKKLIRRTKSKRTTTTMLYGDKKVANTLYRIVKTATNGERIQANKTYLIALSGISLFVMRNLAINIYRQLAKEKQQWQNHSKYIYVT